MGRQGLAIGLKVVLDLLVTNTIWSHAGEVGLTAVSVLERGLLLLAPFWGGMMRLLAISTTSLPLNFFSSSLTSRCWILLKDFFKR